MLNLDDIEAKARAATPGKWRCLSSPIEEAEEHVGYAAIARTHEHNGDYDQDEAAQDAAVDDARFIAAMSPDVALAMVAEIRRLRDEVEDVKLDLRSFLQTALFGMLDQVYALKRLEELRLEPAQHDQGEKR